MSRRMNCALERCDHKCTVTQAQTTKDIVQLQKICDKFFQVDPKQKIIHRSGRVTNGLNSATSMTPAIEYMRHSENGNNEPID